MSAPMVNDPSNASSASAISYTSATSSFPLPTLTPSPILDYQSEHAYAGLPSHPRQLASTFPQPIVPRTGFHPSVTLRQLRPIGQHPIIPLWQSTLPSRLRDVLSLHQVEWSSVDLVRISEQGVTASAGTPVLWIGVFPGTLSLTKAAEVACACQESLSEDACRGVYIELRESLVTRNARLLAPPSHLLASSVFAQPFTSSLGIPISSSLSPSQLGTMGLVLSDGDEQPPQWGLTARHVFFPTPDDLSPDNLAKTHFEHHKDDPTTHVVTLMNNSFWARSLEAISGEIAKLNSKISENNVEIVQFSAKMDKGSVKMVEVLTNNNQANRDSIDSLQELLTEVQEGGATARQRSLGRIIFSPPLSFTTEPNGFTLDVAIIEFDSDVLDEANFSRGNTIDISTLHPDTYTSTFWPTGKVPSGFEFPRRDRLLRLDGVVPVSELIPPVLKDEDGERTLYVLKNGVSTGLTVGESLGVNSFTRQLTPEGGAVVSREWGVVGASMSRSSSCDRFSDGGDSGAVVVDGSGRVAGILTGGSGGQGKNDVTYVTPMEYILSQLAKHDSFANLSIRPRVSNSS